MIEYTGGSRFADDVLLIEPKSINALVDNLCKISQFILICGPRYSGKTYFLNNITTDNYNISKFNSGDWLRQMVPFENLASNKLYESISNLEKTLVGELIDKDAYHLFKETKGTFPENRRIAGQEKKDIVILMFDAPRALLEINAEKTDWHLTEAKKLTNIETDSQLFVWPKKTEGFKKVYYVGVYNTDFRKRMLLEHYQREICV